MNNCQSKQVIGPLDNQLTLTMLRNHSKRLLHVAVRHYNTQVYFMRSLLYIPGNSKKMLSKMLNLQQVCPDVFVPDLEDSVPLSEKKSAREFVREFLNVEWVKMKEKYGKSGLPFMMPRVNQEFLDDDLDAVCSDVIDVSG